MRFSWNSFTVIGLILIVIGIYGIIRGASFQFDAGLPSPPLDGVYYLGVGALMILNGIITVRPLESTADEPADAKPISTPQAPG